MTTINRPRNGVAAVLAILVLGLAGWTAYTLYQTSDGADTSRQPSPHAIDQSN